MYLTSMVIALNWILLLTKIIYKKCIKCKEKQKNKTQKEEDKQKQATYMRQGKTNAVTIPLKGQYTVQVCAPEEDRKEQLEERKPIAEEKEEHSSEDEESEPFPNCIRSKTTRGRAPTQRPSPMRG